MTVDAWLTVGTVGLLLSLLVFTRISADVVFMGALTLLLAMGVVDPADALSGLSNPGMVTVAVLFVVVAGVRQTGGVNWIVQNLLGRPRSLTQAQMRMMLPVCASSAFLNNTPIVAMLIPAISDWARRLNLSLSKLLIPLSYAAILGGTCTLIGTSTNLVVNGMVIRETDLPGLKMFDIAWVGVPCAVIGLSYILLLGRRLLPDRKPLMRQLEDPREYTVEMMVEDNSPLVGKTIEQAGLRHLPGMYVAEIERDGQILPAVGPQEVLRARDRLVLVGVVESVVDLQKIRGLTPATNQVFKLDAPRARRCLIEAVVSNSCPIVGQTIRDGRFRTVYNAVVIAVARSGERIRKKIGDIVLRAGDTLLLEASSAFVEQQRNSRDFFLVSPVADSSPPQHERAFAALLILVGMVFGVTMGWLDMLQAAMLAAGLMLITRCCSATDARRSLDLQVLVVIAAAIGVGRAMEVTGAAPAMATTLTGMAAENPWVALAIIYGVTMLFTELITNNAAAVLVFPIAMATADRLGVNVMPFIITIMMAASATFSSPIGYQTNLMVYGPGGYRFTDYLRVGVPLNGLMWLTTVLLAPRIWPF